MQKTRHIVTNGDARKMAKVADSSVHLIITSPPYWQLKDYGSEEQVGFDDSYADYINNLNLVWRECFRVLHSGCRLCVNIGDQFARSVHYGRYKVIPIRTEIIRFCETIGFDYMGSIIWRKVTTCNTTGGATVMGSFPYPRNGIVKIDYEFILIFKKLGKAPHPSPAQKEASKLSKEEWNEFFNGHWNFSGERQSHHLAMFPCELPRRLIRMFSFCGETVLDPFLGSGTTALAALRNNRNSIGYEINQGFMSLISEKIERGQDLLSEGDLVFETDESRPSESDFETLPYLFADPHGVNKRVDPRKMSFGSRVSSKSGPRQQYFSVAEIVNVNKLRLDNGVTVRLLGVDPIPGSEHAAMDFLRDMLKGKKVFLRFDSEKHDESENLLAYLYLKNRTFINAHLIKKGLARIDNSFDISNRTLRAMGA